MHHEAPVFCIHCDPYEEPPGHFADRIEAYLTGIASGLFAKIPYVRRIDSQLNASTLVPLIEICLVFGIMREVDADDLDESIYNRSLVVAKEAAKRGYTVKNIQFLGRSTTLFSISVSGRKMFFFSLPHTLFAPASIDIDDKGALKELLEHLGLPHPRGGTFSKVSDASAFAATIGYPVVVKPRAGSLSRHTICDIRSGKDLIDAVRVAQMISRDFIVEEFVPGNVYRVTLIDGKIAGVCHREWANVVGDGKRTIQELIRSKNEHPFRAPLRRNNSTLHLIPIKEKAHDILARQNLSLESILPEGVKVYLHDKILMTAGADIHDVTEKVHPENAMLFRTLQAAARAPVMGVDCIFEDISRPASSQRCAIIEANSVPYVDMHHYPVTGAPRNVAGALLDYCESEWSTHSSKP